MAGSAEGRESADFGGAGVPPAVLDNAKRRKSAGKMPAPQISSFFNGGIAMRLAEQERYRDSNEFYVSEAANLQASDPVSAFEFS
jgi:hypothetical protein